VTVTAVSSELAESLARRIADEAEVRRPADEALVTIGFWQRLERRGAYRIARTVRAPAWRDIRMNYGSATAAALDQLLHPAVVRPGRCLAQIEVGPLAAAEAAAWLGAGGDVASPLSLADLYARRRAGAPISSALPPARVGLYL
jgi:hypothetical protein